MPRSSRAAHKESRLRAEDLVVAAGEPISFAAEIDPDPAKIDHFWITIRAGEFGPLRISINTWSLKHAHDGFDARMRIGRITSVWENLPPRGVFPAHGLDYAELESAQPIDFQEVERAALEELLARQAARAILVEAWGSLYLRNERGIHQVHSRRASCSLPTDHIGRDGAIRFYERENFRAEMFLFKYCGQV